jgi:hypothetical protein
MIGPAPPAAKAERRNMANFGPARTAGPFLFDCSPSRFESGSLNKRVSGARNRPLDRALR